MTLLVVIWALGWAMIVLAGLVWLPVAAVLAFGIVIIAGHNLLAVIVCCAQNGVAHWMFESPDLGAYPFTASPGWGLSLPVIYPLWILVVVLLYPVCRWFASIKQRRTDAWLSYV